MKKLYVAVLVTAFSLSVCAQQMTSPLEGWKIGSANDDVFRDMSAEDMNDLVTHQMPYLEVDWLSSHRRTGEEMENWGKGIKARATEAGVTIWSIHLPFGGAYDISKTDEDARKRAVELNKHDMAMSARLLAPVYFIIHPSAEPIAEEERAARIVSSRQSLRELAQYAQELQVCLLVENLPRTCLGNTSAELLSIIDGIDNTAICFDVNHLLIESQTTFIRQTKGRIGSTHMSDYDRVDERHWLPGEGVIDWNELLGELVQTGYRGPFIFEASKGKGVSIKDLADRWNKLKHAYEATLKE